MSSATHLGRLLACLAAIPVFAAAEDAVACTLSVGWGDYPPFYVATPADAPSGTDAAVIRAVAADVGCAMQWRQMPWSESLDALAVGGVDLVAGATRTPEREQFARFTRPYLCNSARLFMRADDLRFPPETLEAMAQSRLRIGIEAGSVYSEAFERAVSAGAFGDRMVGFAASTSLLPALLDRRVDGVIQSTISAAFQTAELDAVEAITATDLTFGDGALHLMLSRKSVPAAHAQQIDDALSAFVKGDGFDAIFSGFWADVTRLRPYADGAFGCR